LSSHLCLHFLSSLFASGFLAKILYAFLSPLWFPHALPIF
jgi:hypothetical protein